jgi:signal transduction histidine kinase
MVPVLAGGRGKTMASTKSPNPRAGRSGADDDLDALRRDLEALRRRVGELQRVSSVGVLAGGICHELNNMLTPVLNYAKLGLRNPDPAFRERAFTKILESAQRAASLTGGVLGLVRPGAADSRSTTDLVRLVEEILLLTAKDLQKHRVRLEFRAIGRPHAAINPAQIQQVLLNLVINARQAMPDGGLLRVSVGLDPTGRTAELAVADTGVGIAPEDLKHIFEPFFTTKAGPDATGLGGTGLGLPVCREIVEGHRGRLRAESRVGVGTTFTLMLPACAEPAPAQPAPRTGAA